MKLRIGQKFILTEEAIDNYGEQFRGKVFKVRQWYDHYTPSSICENDPHGHPGYDGESGMYLYESLELNFAVYEWEVETP